MKLIHLTDLHIAPEGLSEALEGTTDRTMQAIDLINAHHSDAELCVVTGDIVYNPDEAAYALAQTVLSRLEVPTLSLIGNHDDRAMAQRHLSTIGVDANGFLQQSAPISRGRVILLDTKAEGTHGGAFCAARQAWLAQELAAHPGPVWIFMHHAPFATGLAGMDTIGLQADDAQALAALLRGHGQVAHLFFGHYHRPMSGVWQGIPFSSHRSMMWQCALDLTTRDHIPAIQEEAQFAVVLAEEDRTIVHYHDFASRHAPLTLGVPED